MEYNRHTATSTLTNYILAAWLLILPLIICSLFLINTAFADTKKIAITEIVEHPSLQQAKQGILDVLAENGYEIGKNLKIIDKNAQGS